MFDINNGTGDFTTVNLVQFAEQSSELNNKKVKCFNVEIDDYEIKVILDEDGKFIGIKDIEILKKHINSGSSNKTAEEIIDELEKQEKLERIEKE